MFLLNFVFVLDFSFGHSAILYFFHDQFGHLIHSALFVALSIPTNTSAILFVSFPEMGTNSYFPRHSGQPSRISLSFRINNTTLKTRKEVLIS